MISPNIVRVVFYKELRDCLRDRRTLFATVIIPLLLYPIMLLGMAEMLQMAKAKMDQETYEVAIPAGMQPFFDSMQQKIKDAQEEEQKSKAAKTPESTPGQMPNANAMAAMMQKTGTLKFVERNLDEAHFADVRRELSDGKLKAIVNVPADFAKRLMDLSDASVEVSFDRAEQASRDACNRVDNLFDDYKKLVVKDHLHANNLPGTFFDPFKFKTSDVAPPAKVGGSILGVFLPLIFIMMIITGSMHAAIDMTAGEKERATLETLVSSPARPIELILGKFLAVATLAIGNAVLNVGSFAGSFGTTLSMMPATEAAGMHFPWSALPLTLLLLFPLALFFAGLLLAIASFAANHKEAQVYCLPLYLILVVGMVFVILPGVELEGPLLLVPVLNTALLIKELFLSHGTSEQVAFVFFSNCFYAAGAVALAARIFAREEVLFSAQGSLRLFLHRRFFKLNGDARPGDSLLVLALLYPLNFYFQLTLQKLIFDPSKSLDIGRFTVMVLLPQLLLLFLPIGVAWYMKLDIKKLFLWRKPAPRAMIGAVCLGCASFILVQQFVAWQSHFWRFTAAARDPIQEAVNSALGLKGGMALLIMLIGVTPGICEEHLFRGFLQQGLRSWGKWAAIATVGIIFGAYHSPFFNQPVLMLMGMTLAYVAYETRSIWPGALFHCTHNTLTVLAPLVFGAAQTKPMPGQPLPGVPMQYLAPAIAVFAIGILLVRQPKPILNTEVRMAA